MLKDTQVIATTAQSGYTSAIYSGGKFYANKGNTIREINASTGEARVLTLTEQAQHKLFVFGGKLYALPASGATRITEIDMATFAAVKTAQKDFLQLAGNPLALSNTAYIRQRGLMTEMTGLELGLVTSRQLVEIGSGFVSREIATDGTRRLTTAGGEAIDFDADGHLVATTALFDDIYPIGSIYISVGDIKPAFGEWEKLATGKTLWNDNTPDGREIEAGLPNITGSLTSWGTGGCFSQPESGTTSGLASGGFWQNEMKGRVGLNASRSSPVYGRSTTVQPPAIAVSMWKRTA